MVWLHGKAQELVQDANKRFHSHRRYAALGLPYCFERIPTEQDLAAMLLHSPITHAAKVRPR